MIFQKNSFIVTFSFWRQLYIFYQPSLDKYNSCLCRTITGIFSTLKIARTCFCCPISLITMWKHRFWGGRAYIYILVWYVLWIYALDHWPLPTTPPWDHALTGLRMHNDPSHPSTLPWTWGKYMAKGDREAKPLRWLFGNFLAEMVVGFKPQKDGIHMKGLVLEKFATILPVSSLTI